MRRIQYHQQGFTLIEMILVLIIALLLASLGLPAFGDLMARHRLNAATAQVMSDLMLARRRALSQQHSVQILFSRNKRQSYRIWDDLNNDNNRDNKTNGGEIKNRDMTSFGVKITSNNDPRFDPSGSVTNLPSIQLRHLALLKHNTRCITISITGRIKQKRCTYKTSYLNQYWSTTI
jgi:prepilin-type N-terminal cleavage/methylation domain-containing protein